MRYMLLVYLDEHALSDSEREHCYVESAQLARDLSASGNYVSAGPLHPTATATSVRVRNGKRLVTDGPFAETREQLGGYYLIEAPNLDAAEAFIRKSWAPYIENQQRAPQHPKSALQELAADLSLAPLSEP